MTEPSATDRVLAALAHDGRWIWRNPWLHWILIVGLAAGLAFSILSLRKTQRLCQAAGGPPLLREAPEPTDDIWACDVRFSYPRPVLQQLTQGQLPWLEERLAGQQNQAQEAARALLLQYMRQVNSLEFRERMGFHGPEHSAELLANERTRLLRALEQVAGPALATALVEQVLASQAATSPPNAAGTSSPSTPARPR